MENKRIYTIAQFDEGANQKLADLYDTLVQAGLFGEQTPDIPYHFTLGSYDVECCDQVLERVQAVCHRTKAINISLSHIGLFGLRVLFIAPSMNFELLSLYNNLNPSETLNGCSNWVAHATILIDNPDHINTAIPIVAQSFVPFNTKIASIGVYAFFPKKFIAEYALSH